MIYENILQTIGKTPLVLINKLNPNKKIKIYVKIEGQNPGGSVKDRIGLEMIEAAETSGQLNHSKTIIEATSGNTGIGLAMVATVKGYKMIATMSAAMSLERKKMLKAFGVELIETPPEEGTDGAIRKAFELYNSNKEKYWMPDQFNNPNNPLAHYKGTAEEIISDLPQITHFVAGMGTSGTLMGTGRRLKEYNEKIQIVGIEPQMAHKIAGLKNMKEAIVPGIFDETKIDKKIVVYNEEAYETARKLASEEGIFTGMSGGAAMFGALQAAKEIQEGIMVVILPDRGEKYLSTTLFG